jgi:hypothetical protein
LDDVVPFGAGHCENERVGEEHPPTEGAAVVGKIGLEEVPEPVGRQEPVDPQFPLSHRHREGGHRRAIDGQFASATSAFAFRGTLRPPRRPSSAVISTLQALSWLRLARLSGEKPPKTMECTAPIRAQASIATAASTIIGR